MFNFLLNPKFHLSTFLSFLLPFIIHPFLHSFSLHILSTFFLPSQQTSSFLNVIPSPLSLILLSHSPSSPYPIPSLTLSRLPFLHFSFSYLFYLPSPFHNHPPLSLAPSTYPVIPFTLLPSSNPFLHPFTPSLPVQ